ncbi:hypothetical protein [Lactococcus lactis]|uniref:hypothetical protein n=1 Tax=Lactococcus lactis TaxID=1358 RepID=UPI0019128935|nr:hypothetical protein [Lactococcus lactis]WDA69238.1 hypothetical protein IL310_04120 [Lactococcus lactis]
MEGILSTAMEAQLLSVLEIKINEAVTKRSSPDPWANIVTRKEICERFNIKDTQTIANWEKKGLKSYVSPYVDTKTIVYDKREVAKFLGYDNW